MNKLILIFVLLLSSCTEEFKIEQVKNLDDMKCTSKKNCISSISRKGTSFKMVGNDGAENINHLLLVVKNYSDMRVIQQTADHLSLQRKNMFIDFYASAKEKVIHYKVQLKKTSYISGDNGIELIEKIRFGFFQNNF